MNRAEFLKKIKILARQDNRNRQDPRYLHTMGFLVAKGFLYTNTKLPLRPNARLKIDDVIWAGQNIEPRILEVLPAAVLRFKAHFDFDPKKHVELHLAFNAIKKNLEGDFFGIKITKLKPWLNIKLKDGRTKQVADRKITKTFRFHKTILIKLQKLVEEGKFSNQTAALEAAVMRFEL